MKTTSLLVAAALVGLPLIANATETARPVGALTIDLDNSARRFPVELWYEAVAGTRMQSVSFRAPLRPIVVAPGAEPRRDIAKRPLVVLSHGNWGTRYSQAWLALRLVNAGFIVLSTSHPGTVGDDQTVAGRYRLWDRATDVTFALDDILKNPAWASLIDERRIGFVGHSFGGWTAVSLAGGRYDAARQRSFCGTWAKKDLYCEGTLKDDISKVQAGDGGASFHDPRFKAYYIMASGPAQEFDAASLKTIDVPFVVDTALMDEILEPGTHSSALAAMIPGAREIKRPVGHFAYVPECRPIVGAVMARVAGIPICDDPAGVDRAAVHDSVARDVIAFLDAQLRGPDPSAPTR